MSLPSGLPSLAAGTPDEDFGRLYRAFLGARVILGLALAGTQVSQQLVEQTRGPPALLVLSLVYAALTLAHALLPRWQTAAGQQRLSSIRQPQWWASSGLDLAVFTMMLALGGNSGPPVAALFVLPVMMSAVLATRRVGLFAAAVATLGQLGGSLWVSLIAPDWTPSITQAGLAGIGYFATALLAAELAGRLVHERESALGSLALARQQELLNQLVIDEMQEGVLVLDRELQVRAANPAARALLGERDPLETGSPFSLLGERAWSPLAEAASSAWQGAPLEGSRDVVLGFARAPARTLRLRLRRMPGEESRMVLLLEDRAKLLARARQEKLAAMGRMSAGIAHEIRNPLSAISQANALLAEDLHADPGGQRLTGMVASNVKRLQRIVDEVMLLADPADQPPPPMDAAAGVMETALDWQRTQGAAALQLAVASGPLPVLFDPEHLRRVLVNLLDNGWRHAQAQAKPWLRVELQVWDAQRVLLRVLNPSPPLPAQIERHLFEPFHSTRSRSSGLGLYICRELCERYGARIEYLALEHDGEPAVCFSITLRRAA